MTRILRKASEPRSTYDERGELDTEVNRASALNLIETVSAPLFFKDRRGFYLGCNTPFEKYLGITRNRIIGRTVYDISPPELADVYFRADQALFNTGGIQIYEATVSAADGTKRQVVFNKATFTLPNGDIGGLLGLIREHNPQKAAVGSTTNSSLPAPHSRDIAFLQLLAPHMHSVLASIGETASHKSGQVLTRRELEILGWVCDGKSNPEIADILGISTWTVKIHVSNLLKKLNASTRGHAISKAISSGLVDVRNQSDR